ncbi:hypothetical protein [Microcystis sp. M42BS1]|uniref:hypothetical protein n=1 Tax=Microcystis sp. M42BS1 TaxID=2771192 RepID=UPI0025878FDD|nr:hypothetical protein [Microcystis sp. M42BS1]MCA2570661.1 hypothetical protein [Microcystis sp. M42BS1]
MSTINIRFIAVDKESTKTKSGKDYEFFNVTFRNLNTDKVESKKVLPFGAKEVFSFIESVADGFDKNQAYAVARVKNDAGYWEWTEISRQDGEMKPQVQAATNRPQYETAEERAQRQVWIIRQSSIAAACNLLQGSGDPEAALKVAQQFEEFVLRGDVL